MAKKFIIVTTPRSGSQMLCEFLDSQKSIRCQYEIFHPYKVRPCLNLLNLAENNSEVRKRCEILFGSDPNQFIGNRNRNFIEYLKIWEEIKQSEHFGFKVFFSHHIGTNNKLTPGDHIGISNLLKYIKNNNIKIIHLTRNNIFLKYISHKTAGITKNYNSELESIKFHSIGINVFYKEFIEYKKDLLEEEEIVFNFCLRNNIDYQHVTYENLTGENYISFYKNIIKFLGEDPKNFFDISGTPKQKKIKTNTLTLRQKVLNIDNFINEAEIANDTELLKNISILLG